MVFGAPQGELGLAGAALMAPTQNSFSTTTCRSPVEGRTQGMLLRLTASTGLAISEFSKSVP